MISHNATSYEMPEQYRGERVIIRYNCQHLYVLNKHKNVIAKYVYSKRKSKTRRRIWYATDKLRTKHICYLYSIGHFVTFHMKSQREYHQVYLTLSCNPLESASSAYLS